MDDIYKTGKVLWGNDWGPRECEEWYLDEREAYADLGSRNRSQYSYVYHALNRLHGFRLLPDRHFEDVLGLGAAYGDELLPIKSRLGRVVILEASEAFASDDAAALQRRYVRAATGGRLPFPDASFDLITCLGVLHHLPNVEFVINEIARCMKPGAFALIKEPIVSMGDWSRHRPGLTKRERGIPRTILREFVTGAGLTIVSCSLCEFPVVPKYSHVFGVEPYSNSVLTQMDGWLCRALSWNLRYHAENLLQKLRPTCLFIVAYKSE